jgi:hypothetical protein
LQIEGTDIGAGGDIGPHDCGSLVIASSRQTGEAFLTEEDRKRMDTDDMAKGGEFALNVVDGQVLFAQSDSAFADQFANGSMIGSKSWRREEGVTLAGIVAELMAENAKGTGRIAEASRDIGGPEFLEVECTQGFVLPLGRQLGSREELSSLQVR